MANDGTYGGQAASSLEVHAKVPVVYSLADLSEHRDPPRAVFQLL